MSKAVWPAFAAGVSLLLLLPSLPDPLWPALAGVAMLLTGIKMLILCGREAVRIVYGAALLFLVAAGVESFWSSSTSIPAEVKYTVAAMAWTAVIAWLGLAGRGQHAH